MASNGSFYQNGLPLTYTETGLGNVAPGAPVANPASSSFYLSGSAYTTLQNADTLLAAITAQQVLATAQAVVSRTQASNSSASATASAASAAAAAASAVLAGTSFLQKASNLSDLTSVPTALTNLGLNNVNNTSDANKPVSTAQATAIALKSDIASPTFTGVPLAPTAAALTNTTQIATTAFVDAARVVLADADALKAPLASPALTGTPTAPTAAVSTNTTQIATTAFVLGQLATVAPLINGTAAVGVSLLTARQDHVHPTDTTRAPLASPGLTGTPTAPTAAANTNTTQLATTAYADAIGVVATNASLLSSGTIPAARLPNPSSTTLGGVQSLAAVANKWINTISTAGVPSATQPAFTDISGSVAATQMPAHTGDVTTVAGAVATTIVANAVTNAKLATMSTLTLKANITGGAAVPTDSTMSATLDATIGSTRGQLITRGATLWGTIPIGTNTQVLTSNGTDAVWAASAGGGSSAEPFALHAGIGGL